MSSRPTSATSLISQSVRLLPLSYPTPLDNIHLSPKCDVDWNADLAKWYEAACDGFQQAFHEKLSTREKSNTLCVWAGVLRDHANSGASGDEGSNKLFGLAYEKYQVSE